MIYENTAQIRQKLWCDVYLQKESVDCANIAVAFFDKRFNDFSTKDSARFIFGSDKCDIINTEEDVSQRKPLRDVTTYETNVIIPRIKNINFIKQILARFF